MERVNREQENRWTESNSQNAAQREKKIWKKSNNYGGQNEKIYQVRIPKRMEEKECLQR